MSSSSPYPFGRQCVRLMQPDVNTTEYIVSGNLQIGITMPYDRLTNYVGQFPTGGGPDTLTIAYTDTMGQTQGPLVLNVTLWMSDTGYCFISQDGTKQFLVAGVNGAFFDANYASVNARNVAAFAPALATQCTNASGYDYTTLLPDQIRPVTFIVNGQTYTEYSA